jgi:hypothetical protein
MQLVRMPAALAAALLTFSTGCTSTWCHKSCAPPRPACAPPCPGPCQGPTAVAAPGAVPAVPVPVTAPAVESRFPAAPPTALPYNPTPPAPTGNNI